MVFKLPNVLSLFSSKDGQFFWGFRLLIFVFRIIGIAFLVNIGNSSSVTFSLRQSWPWLLNGLFAFCFAMYSMWIEVRAIFLDMPTNTYVDKLVSLYSFMVAVYILQSLISNVGVFALRAKGTIRHVREIVELERSLVLNRRGRFILTAVPMASVFSICFSVSVIIWSLIRFPDMDPLFPVVEHSTPLTLTQKVMRNIGVIFAMRAGVTIDIWITYYVTCFAVFFDSMNTRIRDLQQMELTGHQLKVELSHYIKIFLTMERIFHKAARTMSFGVLFGFAFSFLFICLAACLFVMHSVIRSNWAFILYFIFNVVRIVSTILFCDWMSKGPKQIRNTLRQFLRRKVGPEREQLLTFIQVVDTSDIYITGGGFFTVHCPLLVAVVNSVITYAVILLEKTNTVNPTNKSF